jgi:hypothetical protein
MDLNLVNDMHSSNSELKKMPQGFETEIDFTKFHHGSVYQWARNKGIKIADLQNESFF